jgi:hypothetical protein
MLLVSKLAARRDVQYQVNIEVGGAGGAMCLLSRHVCFLVYYFQPWTPYLDVMLCEVMRVMPHVGFP